MTLAAAKSLATQITSTVYHCDKARAWQGGDRVRVYIELDALSRGGEVTGSNGCPGSYLDMETGVLHFGQWRNAKTAAVHMAKGGAVDQILDLWAAIRPVAPEAPVYTMEERDGDEV